MYVEKKIFINGHEFFINKDLTINQILEYFNYKNIAYNPNYDEKCNTIPASFNKSISRNNS